MPFNQQSNMMGGRRQQAQQPAYTPYDQDFMSMLSGPQAQMSANPQQQYGDYLQSLMASNAGNSKFQQSLMEEYMNMMDPALQQEKALKQQQQQFALQSGMEELNLKKRDQNLTLGLQLLSQQDPALQQYGQSLVKQTIGPDLQQQQAQEMPQLPTNFNEYAQGRMAEDPNYMYTQDYRNKNFLNLFRGNTPSMKDNMLGSGTGGSDSLVEDQLRKSYMDRFQKEFALQDETGAPMGSPEQQAENMRLLSQVQQNPELAQKYYNYNASFQDRINNVGDQFRNKRMLGPLSPIAAGLSFFDSGAGRKNVFN